MDEFLTTRLGAERFEVAARPGSSDFWSAAKAGGWEPRTLRFLAAHCRPGAVFVDIGAWIGPLSLFAGRLGARIIALEPDPVAFAELEANLKRNAIAARLLPAALHLDAGGLDLYAAGAFGDSETSSFAGRAGARRRTPSVTPAALEALIPEGHDVVLKVDVEGHEYLLGDALAELWRRRRAVVHLSLHPRALWARDREAAGDVAARWRAFRETLALLGKFRPARIVFTSAPVAPVALAALVEAFRLSRPKNFSVEISPPL
ncbi:MAG: FkbM family methyltransferase [Amphiplicatus sp.]